MELTEESLLVLVKNRSVKDACVFYERLRGEGKDVSEEAKVSTLSLIGYLPIHSRLFLLHSSKNWLIKNIHSSCGKPFTDRELTLKRNPTKRTFVSLAFSKAHRFVHRFSSHCGLAKILVYITLTELKRIPLIYFYKAHLGSLKFLLVE